MNKLNPASPPSQRDALVLYRSLLFPRRIERRMLRLLRQNKIGKWFSGIGQESIAVGVTKALRDTDYILPMHRNLGVFTTRQVPLYPLFCQLLEREEGFTKGRDRTFHFGSLEHHIVGMISHLAASLPVADGLALGARMRESDQIAVSFCGEGATSEGDFHEAINLAAVWKLPVLFVIENNGYALSTPTEQQYACENLTDRAMGYGISGRIIDGNNLFEVISTIEKAREEVLDSGPMLVEAKTFRRRGHEEASGTWYVPDEQLKRWKEKDPVQRFEEWLLSDSLVENSEELEKIQAEVDREIEQPLQKALETPLPSFNREKEEGDTLADDEHPAPTTSHASGDTEKVDTRFIDGIQNALFQAFREDESLIMMGQDIAEYGGVFKVTEGFLEEFGEDRIRNTPITESAVLGTALGLALEGYKPVVEMQFADFISCGMNQIINNIAKGQWRWMPPLNITIRGPHGAGVGAGPFHSASPEGWFMPYAGLKIVVPATVRDAQNLTYSALFDPNPVLLFEHKKLYRSLKDTIPKTCYYEPLGKAKVRREGEDATIITFGLGVRWALEAAREMEKSHDAHIRVLDLRCLHPLDNEAIGKAVRETHKILLLQEPSRTLGPMSEISSLISEAWFEYLDAPILRCSSLDTPVPSASTLEEGYLPTRRLPDRLVQLLEY